MLAFRSEFASTVKADENLVGTCFLSFSKRQVSNSPLPEGTVDIAKNSVFLFKNTRLRSIYRSDAFASITTSSIGRSHA